MKITYKTIIHKEEGNKDHVGHKCTWGLAERDLVFCCKEMENHHGNWEFFNLKFDNLGFVTLDWDEKHKPREQPILCITTREASTCDDQEDFFLPINNCPFCGEKFEYVETEVKEITHHRTKETKTYEESIDHPTERIIKK